MSLSSSNKKTLLAIGVAAGLAVIAGWGLSPKPVFKPASALTGDNSFPNESTSAVLTSVVPPLQTPTPVTPNRPEQTAEPDNRVAAPTTWNSEQYAHSLAGTDIDGNLAVDGQGNLILDLNVKDFFDYFLSAVGEVTPEQAIEQIQQQASLRVPPNAVEQAMGLLEDYLAYQQAMQSLMAEPIPPEKQQDYGYYAEVMARTFEQLKVLRRQFFSPEAADAFFALEETYSEYAVAAMQIRADATLTEAQKQQKVQQLESTMPTQMRQAQEEARLTAELALQARTLYEQGSSKDEIRSLLSMRYDSETVEGMLAYYQRESEWNERLKTYSDLKAQLDQAGLTESELNQQQEALRARHFTKDELPRVLTHEAIARKQG